MITCLFHVYNEESRIELALRGARAWANEIIVRDKGSQDKTVEIARDYGAQIVPIPFSLHGDDDPTVGLERATNDWVLSLTPSDQPTPNFIKLIKQVTKGAPEATDIIQVPVKMYTFGDFTLRPNGPWSISYQPKLFNRKNAKPIRKVHVHFAITNNSLRIPYSEDAHIVHCTHPTFSSFMASHVSYALVEAKEATNPRARAAEALSKAKIHDAVFSAGGDRTMKQFLAWKIYHYMIAIACLEKAEMRNIPDEYRRLLSAMVEDLENSKAGQYDC